MIRKQLSIFVENEPGVLARVTRALADGGVNLHAMSVSDNADDAVLRIVVDDDRKAIDLLEQHSGALVVSRDVVEVALPDKPGALASVAALLAKRGINISYAYGSGGGGSTAHLYLRVGSTSATEVDAVIQAEVAKLR
jgi:hypothetical protein